MFNSTRQYDCLRCQYGGGSTTPSNVWDDSSPPARKSGKTGWIVAGATVLGVGIVALSVLGAMHGVFGTSAQTLINQTLPQFWNQTVVPFVSSKAFHAGLIGTGVGLATAGALAAMVYCCRQKKPQQTLIINGSL